MPSRSARRGRVSPSPPNPSCQSALGDARRPRRDDERGRARERFRRAVSAQLRRHGARARVRREATRRSIVDDRANDRLRDALRDDERSTDDDDDDAWFPQAHKPTVVTHSAVGKFTSSEATDLIVAKSTRLEVYRLHAEGLKPVLDVPINGRIATMSLCQTGSGDGKARLYLTTERYGFTVLSYDEANEELKTEAFGDVRDNIGRPADDGQIGIVDDTCRAIGLRLYDGLFKVIPCDEKGGVKEAFNIRLEELRVEDIKFLHGTPKPTIAVLYRDTKDAVHIKTYEIGIREKEFVSSPWAQNDLEGGSNKIIPVPAPIGGVVVLGQEIIVYLNKFEDDADVFLKAINIPNIPDRTNITCYGAIDPDGSRYLLGDADGTLYLLVILHDGKRVRELKIERLGDTSIASTLSYLDNGVVFVGSTYGDSQLIKLHAEKTSIDKDGNPTYVQILEEFTNLGPIVDFAFVDLERHGQGQVVTCSGALKDGSLRVVRNGIGIDEQAVIQLPGVKGLFSLRDSDDSQMDKYLVVTFINETRILGFVGDEGDTLDETEIAGFDAEAQTLCCGNMQGNVFLQVTHRGVRLVSRGGDLLDEWKPKDGAEILSAKCNPTQILVAAAGGQLHCLNVAKGKIVLLASKTFENEIACLDCTPMGDGMSSPVCAVGLWSMDIVLASMSDLSVITKESTDEDIIPRSTLLCSFEDIPYLFVGLGDGQLITYVLDQNTGALSGRKKLSLGTKPITLQTFKSHATNVSSVFAASDRPTVIFSNNKKLIYSNVNVQEVLHVCPFSSEAFPDALALAGDEDLTIGGIDDIQKLHIRTIPLGGHPRRIAHQVDTNTFAVAVEHLMSKGDQEVFIRLIDDGSFDTLHQFRLEEHELVSSLMSCSFAGDSREYYVVGTGFAYEQEDEPSRGRILVLRVEADALELVSEKEVRGAVYNLNAFKGKLLAGINSKLELFKWTPREDDAHELVSECSHHGQIITFSVKTRGDWILVGDLMKSMSLLQYKPEEGAIDEIARDFNANWMTAVAMLDDDETYLGAENSLNLFTVARNMNAMTDEERSRLEITGEYHLGEFVNVFSPGSLVMSLKDGDSLEVPTLLFGTGNGVIGVLASLPKDAYDFAERLQTSMNKHIQGVGGLKHAEWRSFRHTLRGKSDPSRNFVDGDLVESFLDLKVEQADVVAADMKCDRAEIIRRVEELQRLTH